MRLVRHVSRVAIEADIRAAHYPGHDPARWALPLIAALEHGDVQWSLVELEPAETAALWLPAHAGEPCHGDRLTLGAAAGGTLAAQAEWLQAHAAAYAEANPSCWGRIERARLAEASPLVVATASVGDRVKPEEALLVVVDGLHRALGDWRAGRRAFRAYLPGHGTDASGSSN